MKDKLVFEEIDIGPLISASLQHCPWSQKASFRLTVDPRGSLANRMSRSRRANQSTELAFLLPLRKRHLNERGLLSVDMRILGSEMM